MTFLAINDLLTARKAIADLRDGGVLVRSEIDTALWEDAAQLKADWRRVSLADCFGIALSRRLGAEFITGDRHELETLAGAGVARFIFIR